ncbi:MAG: hypothetical protein ABR508_13095, partial [Candidatus Baltobacteraceae bacterium]
MRRFIGPFMTGLGIAISCLWPQPASAAANAAPGSPAAIRAYAGLLHKINPHMPGWQSRELARHLLISSKRWKVDANVLVALVSVESAWR